MNYNIKEMVKDGKKVTFQFYRKNELWYKTECGFLFPVPIDDIGDATFNSQEKAILLMRYISKWITACVVDSYVRTDANNKLEILDGSGNVIGAQG